VWTLAVTTTMGTGSCDMIRRVASIPSMPGSRMSIAITSGEIFSSLASASSALTAVAQTSNLGSRPML
jgi:hypothetical protein